jgi:hypothetical protein
VPNRALIGLVVTLSATPNELCRRKSILRDLLAARVWSGFEADLRQIGSSLWRIKQSAVTSSGNRGSNVWTPPLSPLWEGSGLLALGPAYIKPDSQRRSGLAESHWRFWNANSEKDVNRGDYAVRSVRPTSSSRKTFNSPATKSQKARTRGVRCMSR